MFINFYADWCHFSNLLSPVFDEAADKIKEKFSHIGQVVVGKVDCDKQGEFKKMFFFRQNLMNRRKKIITVDKDILSVLFFWKKKSL